MKKQKFVDLIRDYQNVSTNDLSELKELEDSFPYSQAIRNLVAKASFDNKTQDAKKRISNAAIYATDRGVLKSLIENQLELVEEEIALAEPEVAPTTESSKPTKAEQKVKDKEVNVKVEEKIKEVPAQKKKEPEKITISRPEASELEKLRAEVLQNLEELQGYKQSLPEFFSDGDEIEATPKAKKVASKKQSTTTKTTSKKKSPSAKKATGSKAIVAKKTATRKSSSTSKSAPKSKKATSTGTTKAKATKSTSTSKKTTTTTTKKAAEKKPIAKKKATKTAATKQTTKASSAKSSTKKASTSKKKLESDLDIPSLDFLNESELPKKKPKSTRKRGEQDQIINDFISSESEIKIDPTEAPKDEQDLSVSSAKPNEELISENLAQILTKQGKNEKAIEIYKKLIWKFPQKKAYFASQIESLRK